MLTLRALWLLVWADWTMRRSGIHSLHKKLAETPRAAGLPRNSAQLVCGAVDLACVLYFKPVLCLQRSVTAALLLRRYGHAADLVVGARPLPFRSHAWAEIAKTVVNDKSYISELYPELVRSQTPGVSQ